MVRRSRWRRKTSVGPPADLVTIALTRRATRSRTGIARCRSSMHREVGREGEGASRTGARFGRPWGQSHCLSGPVSAQVLSARHDGTRPAHAPCGLTRFMEWELDSRRSDWPESAQADAPAQEAAVWQSDPKRAVPARMTKDARGRTRPSEAPPAVRREGSAPEPKAPPAENVLATRSTARCLGTRVPPKRVRFTAHHL